MPGLLKTNEAKPMVFEPYKPPPMPMLPEPLIWPSNSMTVPVFHQLKRLLPLMVIGPEPALKSRLLKLHWTFCMPD